MRLGIEFVPNMPIRDLVDYAVLAEQNGIGYLWLTEHYNNRNVYASLSQIATRTSKIYMGPGVTNTFTVNPAVTASAIASIDELSGGRAMLGIGPGDITTLATLGIPMQSPVARLKDGVSVIRKLLSGEQVSMRGQVFNISGAQLNFKPVRDIPVYIGALGPAMLKIAGEIGDGCLINASHPVDFEEAVPLIKEGSKGRKGYDIAAYTCFSIDEDAERAKKAVKPVVAFIIAGCSESALRRHKIDLVKVISIKNNLRIGDFKSAFRAIDDNMIEAFSLNGSPEGVIEKIKVLEDRGVTQIVAGIPQGLDMKKSILLIGKYIAGRI